MSTSHLQDNLDLLQRETDAFTDSIASLGETQLRAPTLCPGWTRAHVIAHVARNADALGNLLHWAATGERTEAYGSPEQRDADIEAGAHLGAAELVEDHRRSAQEFARRARDLHGPAGDAEVVTRTGTTVRGSQVPSMRLLEVVFHHVDLQLGYTFADADPGFVQRSLRQGARRLQASAGAPDLTLVSAEGEEWVIGEGTQYVRGPRADLLLWLARGVETGLEHDAPLPDVPAWA